MLLNLIAASTVLAQPIVSDDFNRATVDASRWETVDPFSDATFVTTGAGSGDAHLQITVPGNQSHDSYNARESVLVLQTIEDQDFALEVKYDSLPAHDYQTEGFWIEDSDGNAIRACIQFLNGTLRLWVGRNIGTPSASQIASVNFADVAPPTTGYSGTLYERLTRTGSSWSVSISADGFSWVDLADFQLDAVVTKIGLEAGNYVESDAQPDWVMSVDYFFNMAAPIAHEDGSTANVAPSVAISGLPNYPVFAAGSIPLSAEASDRDGSVAKVEFFAATSLLGTATQSPFAMTWENAMPGVYSLTARATDDEGANTLSAPVKVFVLNSTGAIISDDFNHATLNTAIWAPIDPVGDGRFAVIGAGTGEAQLQITVPGGHEHDAWIQNHSLRLMQVITNQDFTVEAKFDTLPSEPAQFEGIIVEDAEGVGLRFDAALARGFGYMDAWTGHGIDSANAGQEAVAKIEDLPQPPAGLHVGTIYLRVTRQGTEWTSSTSPDGVNWTESASFSNDLVPARIGVFAGNAFSPPPAITALVDYFINTAATIALEDGASTGAPSVTLTSPAEGAVLDAASSAGLAAEASAGRGTISKVEFYAWTPGAAASTLIGTATGSPFNTTWNNVAVGTWYVYAKATASDGPARVSSVRQISITSTPGGAVFSDDFNQVALDLTRWQMVNPFGDATFSTAGGGSGDAHLEITVPGNRSHDSYTTRASALLLQTVKDQDFSVDVKYDSLPALDYQTEGLWIEDTAGNAIRAGIQFVNGTLRLWVGRNIGTASASQIASVDFPDVAPPADGYSGTLYQRLTRSAWAWSVFISPDGVNWVDLADFELEAAIAKVGLEAGNYVSGDAQPDWVMRADYFFQTGTPIVPEDPKYNVETLKLNAVARDVSGGVVISWAGTGVLEEAPTVTGTWTPSANQATPQTVTPVGPTRFYRLKRP